MVSLPALTFDRFVPRGSHFSLPDSAMDNFYTVTVYNKGAEVCAHILYPRASERSHRTYRCLLKRCVFAEARSR